MQPKFSTRTNWNLETTRYAQVLDSMRAAKTSFIDLTVSNPTVCGFDYDSSGILHALSEPECLRYDPDPRGLLLAREAVAQYYAAAAARVAPERIFLTASTSEAYGHLFRLHCDPGSEVLIAEPSYPLFEYLAGMDDVRLISYPLFYDYGWQLDVATLESRITPRTRAVAVVHPNNPTGHSVSVRDRAALERICLEHGLVLIVDEVFLDYPVEKSGARGASEQLRSFASGDHPVLTYVLRGLSKVAALPQMKLAWIAGFGPEDAVEEALARLEMIADTFLSVNTPIQYALPFLLEGRGAIQQQIRVRVRKNLEELDRQLHGAPTISRLKVEAGWCIVLRVPALESGEALVARLLEQRHVAVHPGYFYGFDGDGWIVVSLLLPDAEFARGVKQIIHFFG